MPHSMFPDILPRTKGSGSSLLRLGSAFNVAAMAWIHVLYPATVKVYEHFCPVVAPGNTAPGRSTINVPLTIDPVKARPTIGATPSKVSQPPVVGHTAPFALPPAPPKVPRPQVEGEKSIFPFSINLIFSIFGLFLVTVIAPIVCGIFVHQNTILDEPPSWPIPPTKKDRNLSSPARHPATEKDDGPPMPDPSPPPSPPPPPPPPGTANTEDAGPPPRPIPMWLLLLFYLILSSNAARIVWSLLEALFPRQVEAVRRRLVGGQDGSPAPPLTPTLRERLAPTFHILISTAIASRIAVIWEWVGHAAGQVPFLVVISRGIVGLCKGVAPLVPYIIAATMVLSSVGFFLYTLHQRVLEEGVAAFGEEDEVTVLGALDVKKEDNDDDADDIPEPEGSDFSLADSETHFDDASLIEQPSEPTQAVQQPQDEEKFYSTYADSREFHGSSWVLEPEPVHEGEEREALSVPAGHGIESLLPFEGDVSLPAPEANESEPLPTNLTKHVDSVDLLHREPKPRPDPADYEEPDYSVEYMEPAAPGNFSAGLNDSVEMLRRSRSWASSLGESCGDDEGAGDVGVNYDVLEDTNPLELEAPLRASTPPNPMRSHDTMSDNEVPLCPPTPPAPVRQTRSPFPGGRRTVEELESIFAMFQPRPGASEEVEVASDDSLAVNQSMTSRKWEGDDEGANSNSPYSEILHELFGVGRGPSVKPKAHPPAASPSSDSNAQPLDVNLRITALLNESKKQMCEADAKLREAISLRYQFAKVHGDEDASGSFQVEATPPLPMEVNVVPPTPPAGQPGTPPLPADEVPQFLDFVEPEWSRSSVLASLPRPSPPVQVPSASCVAGYDLLDDDTPWDQSGLSGVSLPTTPELPSLPNPRDWAFTKEMEQVRAEVGAGGQRQSQSQADETFEIPLDDIAKWGSLMDPPLSPVLQPDDSADWKLTEEMKQFWAGRAAKKTTAEATAKVQPKDQRSKVRELKGEKGTNKEKVDVDRRPFRAPSRGPAASPTASPTPRRMPTPQSALSESSSTRGSPGQWSGKKKGKEKENVAVERPSVAGSFKVQANLIPQTRAALSPMRQATGSASRSHPKPALAPMRQATGSTLKSNAKKLGISKAESRF